MARQRALTHQNNDEEVEIIDVESEDISQLADDMDAQLGAITAEFDKDENDIEFLIKIYKMPKDAKKKEWMFDITPSELPILARIRDNYGGGVYPVRVYRNGKLFRAFEYRIAEALPFSQRHQSEKSSNDITSLVNALLESNRQTMEQMQKMMMENRQQPMQQQPSMAEMMKEFATMMVSMQQLVPQPTSSSSDVEMLIKGITLAKDFGNDAGDAEANLYTTLNKTVETFGPVMANALQRGQRQPSRLPNPIQGGVKAPGNPHNPAQPVKQLSNNHGDNNDMNLIQKKMLQTYGAILVGKAAEDADTLLYANLVIDNVDNEMLEKYVLAENGLDELTALLPDISKHRPWFEQLRQDVIDEIKQLQMENETTTIQSEGGASPGAGNVADKTS